MNPHLTWIISLPHATALIKKMNQKKNRDAGYFFDLVELENRFKAWDHPERMMYANYKHDTVLFKLNIFYEKP